MNVNTIISIDIIGMASPDRLEVRMKKAMLVGAAVVVLAGTVLVLAGCGSTGTSYGQRIPADNAPVSARAILGSPDTYNGRTVVVRGYYAAGTCQDCFLLKDGTTSVRVEATREVPLPPRSKLNSPMKLMGVVEVRAGVTPGEKTVAIVASGLSFD